MSARSHDEPFAPERRHREELLEEGELPVYALSSWVGRFPWLVQGITGGGRADDPFDLALFGTGPAGEVHDRWRALARFAGLEKVVHARQVHGSRVQVHGSPVQAHGAGEDGLLLTSPADGHATRTPGVLLAITVADCVPIYLVEADSRSVALLHAGWRGVAAGILSEGISVLSRISGAGPESFRMHLGPAICGECYEVGPEVHRALGGEVPEGEPEPVDLRAHLLREARDAGIPPGAATTSAHCTRCGDGSFFSHRAGDGERQVAFLGVRPGDDPR